MRSVLGDVGAPWMRRRARLASCLAAVGERSTRGAISSKERSNAVAAWRDAPYFSDAERAALALIEAVTRLSDRADPVPDEIWDEAARHHDEKALAALVIEIALINVWNRFNVTTRQVASPAAW
jgi:alkylhydroperoxidase family enzyme